MRSFRAADLRRGKAPRNRTIKLGPGVYDLGGASLRMRPGIDIEGSGVERTEIVGLGQRFGAPDFSFDKGVIIGADGAEIRDLTVRCVNTSELDTCITMANVQASPSLDNVRLLGVHPLGGGHWGVRNNESAPLLTDVEIVVANGANNFGMVNDGARSRPEIRRGSISAVGGTGRNVGIFNRSQGLPVRLSGVEISVMNGFHAIGIMTEPPGGLSAPANDPQDLATMRLMNVEVSAIDAGHTYGFFLGNYSLEMMGSRVLADDSAIDLAPEGDVDVAGSELRASEFFAAAANVRITGSTLLGGAEVVALEAECSGVTTEAGASDTCP